MTERTQNITQSQPAPERPTQDQTESFQAKRHSKPLLTIGQQIAHMKAKGIAFELCSEEEAASHLRTKCQFFRVYAYRKLFPKHVGGPRDGQYVNLDFGHLKTLSNLDRMLRDVLLPMTLDVEHFAKVRLLAAAEDHGEDGYALMRDYYESRSEEQRSYIESELDRRMKDPYVGAVVRKYRYDMPVWAFCEVVPFGMFSGLVKSCADRWEDEDLQDVHYLLKYTRSVHNATAHGACGVNGLTDADPHMRPPASLVNALTSTEVPKRLRAKWLRGTRMVQMCAMLHLYAQIVPAGEARAERERHLASLFAAVRSGDVPVENPAVAALLFIERLTKAVGLLQ
ncbi:Abi family protein [Collinsella tanakaei]|nr:Abi family protein [Collinsella tanakaei]